MIPLDPCQPADEVAKLLSINFYVSHSHPAFPPVQPFASKCLIASLPFPALSGWAGGPADLGAGPWVLAHSEAQQRNCLMQKA